ncbi:4'-phosphopantetheinyl transferase superfamily protein [Mucilaginibacter sp. KACC 22063]|uniref:4'-phosphopantetheinyl transferase superfamily protein n=1 Tax=Mucilaginibacter sp. KACC 22063 TaxID=3025666 RepID=UPI0023664BBE|nr:4'-phosphopantetheinyl transferase superfamily protein [Mucilaginibacter sp. KACC 22063]WDF55461.1 4'-phosphopantetheinyl transferase superfamily protein [Mucilaginibacter sp. KACC 22063]
MISIGNDIVDLKHIDKQRTCDRRFFSKILSPQEELLFSGFQSAQLPFEVFVWLLWSAKESVYKFLKRHQPGLVFSPVKFQVVDISTPLFASAHKQETALGFDERVLNMELLFAEQQYHVKSVVTPPYIASFISADFNKSYWGIRHVENPDPESLSAAVRLFAKERLVQLYPDLKVDFKKHDTGYPFIESTSLCISFSHHGNWVSYAFTQ